MKALLATLVLCVTLGGVWAQDEFNSFGFAYSFGGVKPSNSFQIDQPTDFLLDLNTEIARLHNFELSYRPIPELGGLIRISAVKTSSSEELMYEYEDKALEDYGDLYFATNEWQQRDSSSTFINDFALGIFGNLQLGKLAIRPHFLYGQRSLRYYGLDVKLKEKGTNNNYGVEYQAILKPKELSYLAIGCKASYPLGENLEAFAGAEFQVFDKTHIIFNRTFQDYFAGTSEVETIAYNFRPVNVRLELGLILRWGREVEVDSP